MPKGTGVGPVLFCYYQFLNNSSDHGYFFGLSGSDKSNSDDVWGIGLYTDSLPIHTGIFNLINNGKGNFFGKYTRANQGGSFFYYASSTNPGTITITRFDSVNQIVSGSFEFDVLDNNSDTFKVRSGRFDMHYAN